MKNKLRPIHPGEILQEEIDELGISATALGRALKIPTNRVTAILKGNRSITADTALRLAQFFGTTPELWMNLQSTYDIKIAEKKVGKKIEREVEFKDAA